jgi:hypothetical protein
MDKIDGGGAIRMRLTAMMVLVLVLAERRAGAQDSMPMAGMGHTENKAAQSSSLAVTAEGRTTSFSVSELSAMPQTTVTVMNAHTKIGDLCRGSAERGSGEGGG